MDRLWLAALGSVLAFCVLALVGRGESKLASARGKSSQDRSGRAHN